MNFNSYLLILAQILTVVCVVEFLIVVLLSWHYARRGVSVKFGGNALFWTIVVWGIYLFRVRG